MYNSVVTTKRAIKKYWDPKKEINHLKIVTSTQLKEEIPENSEIHYNLNDDDALLLITCAQGRCELAKGLIESGYDVNQKDNVGFTPIMRAATNGHKPVVELLISYGAKINLQLLSLIKNKINRLKKDAKQGKADPYSIACWKNFLDYIILEGNKQ
jgi:ankyrin repeat protein